MSTRCNIVVKEGRRTSYLYHHYDGYPSGVGSMLKEYLDNQYNWYQYEMMNDIIKNGIKYIDTKGTWSYDHEFNWTPNLHGDIDYIYVIDCNKRTLTCYKRPGYVRVTKQFEKEFTIVEIPEY